MKEVTPSEAGMKKDEIYSVVFRAAIEKDRPLEMAEIYQIVNAELEKRDFVLSDQGKNSLRRLINTVAVNDGYIFRHEKESPGWRITQEARSLIEEQGKQTELVYNQETEKEEVFVSNSVKGALFEKYCLGLLKLIYPHYSWFHQGVQKSNERGLDLIAEKLGEVGGEYKCIGAQVKNHKENNIPNEKEWLKFLAGCFVRRIDKGIFITTGRLSSEQRREAGEGKITVVEGIDEINRLAATYKYAKYEDADF